MNGVLSWFQWGVLNQLLSDSRSLTPVEAIPQRLPGADECDLTVEATPSARFESLEKSLENDCHQATMVINILNNGHHMSSFITDHQALTRDFPNH